MFIYIIGGIFCLQNTEKNREFELLSKNDEKVGNFIKLNTPYDSIIFSRPRYFQPASFIAGRQILIGYPKYVWQNGNDKVTKYLSYYRLIDHHINSTIDIMKEIKASYVLLNKNDSNFLFSLENNRNAEYKIKKIYSDDEWSLYNLLDI